MATPAEMEAKIQEIEQKLKDAQEAHKKAQDGYDNAQKVIQQHRTKMGEDAEYKKTSAEKTLELTDRLTAAIKERDEAKDLLGQLQGEVAELKKQGPKPKEQPIRTLQEQVAAEAKKLTDEDRKALDAVVANAPQDVKTAMEADEPTEDQLALRLELLKELRRQNPAPSVPFWKRHTPTPKESPGGDEMSKTIKSLFETAKKSAGYTPEPPRGGTPRNAPPGTPPERKPRTPPWMP